MSINRTVQDVFFEIKTGTFTNSIRYPLSLMNLWIGTSKETELSFANFTIHHITSSVPDVKVVRIRLILLKTWTPGQNFYRLNANSVNSSGNRYVTNIDESDIGK